VTYSQGGMTLEFRRVEGEGEGVSFVATTEVAVGQFIEMVGSRGEEFRAFLPKSDAGGVDPRTGPRTWVWSGSNLTMAKEAGPGDLAKGWVRIKTQMAGREYYPGGVNVGPVTAEHPMQYLSPKAALFAARLSGCRLPTPSEWKGAGGVAAGGNLRDATWKKVHDHLMQFAQSGPEFPGAGIFWPTGVTRRSPLDDAQPAVTTDDGMVWFAPVVGTGSGFQHLNGNVAEYAFEDGPSWDAVAATKDAVDAAVGRGEKVRVIGGSALSPAEIKLDQAYPVSASQSREGFSDVGFRLAFSAPKGAIAAGTADRLKTALAAGGYLKGESRK